MWRFNTLVLKLKIADFYNQKRQSCTTKERFSAVGLPRRTTYKKFLLPCSYFCFSVSCKNHTLYILTYYYINVNTFSSFPERKYGKKAVSFLLLFHKGRGIELKEVNVARLKSDGNLVSRKAYSLFCSKSERAVPVLVIAADREMRKISVL